MSKPEFLTFESREALSAQLADDVAALLSHGVSESGQAGLIVSGGSTPKPFFQALKAKPLAWSNITVSLADERFVDVSSDDSTEKLVREHLLHDDARYLSMAPKNAGETLEQGCARIADLFKDYARAAICADPSESGLRRNDEVVARDSSPLVQNDNPIFNTVILGMGEDGHTASLFPHHPMLQQGLDLDGNALCLPITDSPKPPPERITLTAAALTNCRQLILYITGDAKREVYEKVVATADAQEHPIYAFIAQQRVPLTVYWAA